MIYLFFDEAFILKYLIIQIKQSAVRTLWHPKLNQIFVTTGSGEIKVFYDPEKSQRGITQCALKAVKRKTGGAYFASNQIMNPHALPIFKKVILFNYSQLFLVIIRKSVAFERNEKEIQVHKEQRTGVIQSSLIDQSCHLLETLEWVNYLIQD